MKKNNSYQDYLIASLKNHKEAAIYLNVALEDGDPEVFLLALRNVAQALGGVSKISKKTKLNRTTLYRILSKYGNPEWSTLDTLLRALGFKLAITLEKHKDAA